MTRTFGQLDHREARNGDYQKWLGCSRVLPDGKQVPPPARIDVAGTVKTIREMLPCSDLLQVDVQNDEDSILLVRAQLTPAENARVQFSARRELTQL